MSHKIVELEIILYRFCVTRKRLKIHFFARKLGMEVGQNLSKNLTRFLDQLQKYFDFFANKINAKEK